MNIQEAVARRARALAFVLATSVGGIAVLIAWRTLHSPLPRYASADAVWAQVLQLGLLLASCWACAAAISSYRTLAETGTRQSNSTKHRLLVATLLTLATWTLGSTGSAAHASAHPTEPSSPVAVVATRAITAPSPDFVAAAAPVSRAATSPGRIDTATPPANCPVPEPSWLPSAPRATTPADRSPLLMPCHRAGATEVVVRRGDTLWAIAARHLPDSATAAQIARSVPQWHATNRAVIGSDPDVLLVGQVLTVPSIGVHQ